MEFKLVNFPFNLLRFKIKKIPSALIFAHEDERCYLIPPTFVIKKVWTYRSDMSHVIEDQ